MDRLFDDPIEFHIQLLFHNLIGFISLDLSSCLFGDSFCHMMARVKELLIINHFIDFILNHVHLINPLVLSSALFPQKVNIFPRILNKPWDIANAYSKLLWDKKVVLIFNDDTLDDSELVI